MEVPESNILGTGTADPLADTRTQHTIELPENAMTRPEGDWDLVVHGKLMTFANPGFDPNGCCVYKRVLVAVESNDFIRPVWLYHYNPGHDAERITSGKCMPK